jgi:hypothetical protein
MEENMATSHTPTRQPHLETSALFQRFVSCFVIIALLTQPVAPVLASARSFAPQREALAHSQQHPEAAPDTVPATRPLQQSSATGAIVLTGSLKPQAGTIEAVAGHNYALYAYANGASLALQENASIYVSSQQGSVLSCDLLSGSCADKGPYIASTGDTLEIGANPINNLGTYSVTIALIGFDAEPYSGSIVTPIIPYCFVLQAHSI